MLDDAERSIAHAIKLGHTDDGSLQIRLARIHVRRHNADTSNSQRDLRAALASFYEALKFKRVESQAVHYLEVSQFVSPPKGVARGVATPVSRDMLLDAREGCSISMRRSGST